jgi:FkbM family methyltransferase
MGAPFIDYIVADRTIIEEEDLEYYSEKIIWMPHSYQVNDGKRLVSTRVFTRKECELPEFGFVFCCFNNSYKILPETFNAWMRILKQVDGSILWLFEGHPDAPHNLRNEAAARGIDPNRLIFAKKLDPAEHLARHRLADLFIDTWPYNAHTTASDALWTGLPVITLKGLSFASRVAASLLNAVGMSELITESIEQYEELAVSLALDPNRLLELKQRLKVNLLTEPLFDCERFTRNLESAYQDVMTNYLNKQSPSNIYVIDIADSKAKETATASNLSQVVRTNMSKHSKVNQEVKAIEQVVDLNKQIEVLDVGAACIAEEPVYRRLIIRKSAHLHAFEGDERQITKIRKAYGDNVTIHRTFLYDGSEQTAYIAAEESGMTSLLPPKLAALKFFNGFEHFGTVHSKQKVQTSRLDDIPNLPSIDFVKMDIQGAELTVLKNAEKALSQCIAIQLEVSYIPLYEGQPCFGEIDIWMRSKGFVPHLLMDVKRWSIAPTIRNNDIRVPFNQLLESDIVYIRDPLEVEKWDIQQIKKLAVIAHECFASIDLTIYLLNELIRRNPALASLRQDYLLLANAPRAR